MTATVTEIRDVANAIEQQFAGVLQDGYVTSGARAVLQDLAYMCGVEKEYARMIGDREALTLFKVVRQNPNSGFQVAQRINRAMAPPVVVEYKEVKPTAYGKLPDILSEPFVPPPAKTAPLEEPVLPPPATPAVDMSKYVLMSAYERHLKARDAEIADMKETDKEILRTVMSDLEAYDAKLTNVQSQVSELALKAGEHVKEHVNAMVQEALKHFAPTVLEIKGPGAPPEGIKLGTVHKVTPRIIRALSAGLNVYLHGPAGSGKTTAGRKAAEAFLLPFYTAAKVESEYLLLGFKDARGETVRTQFREAYEHGGVFLFDELDASAPGAVVALNMALANGICPFPDGNVVRHPNFHCIAAGNTVMTGASRQYTGRSQMDAASIDRFYFIEFGYDEELERALATNVKWCAHVQKLRAAVKERGLPHLITPRATLDGCKALDMGDTWEEAEMACIFKGLDTATVDQLRRAVR